MISLVPNPETFTREQERGLGVLVDNHPDVQMLLARIVEMETEFYKMQEEMQLLREDKSVTLPRAIQKVLAGGALVNLPGTHLAQFMTGLRRYIELTENHGAAARRLSIGDFIIDLGHPDLGAYLPPGMSARDLYNAARARKPSHTRRTTKEDREAMEWPDSERHPLAFVYIIPYHE